MLTAKMAICSDYISQIDRIARIYVAADGGSKAKSGATNEPKLLGDGGQAGEAKTESTVFNFDTIFA